MADFYRARRNRPVWFAHGVRAGAADAQVLQASLAAAPSHGLNADDYGARSAASLLARAVAAPEDPAAAAQAELALSAALAHYGAALRRPAPAADLLYADPALQPFRPDPRGVLEGAGRALKLPGGLPAYIAALAPANPPYHGLQRAIGPANPASPRLLANLERARALPAYPGKRFVIVDAAAARLWMYEDGRPVDTMRVVVGKRSDPTPAISGLIRQAVFQPYWNVPVDLVRRHLAGDVLRQGPGLLAARHLEVLSDWTPMAVPVDPAAVDWRAVASGAKVVRVRQRPGPDNMLGGVKYTFPNHLGIYLHDTPMRDLFSQAQRNFSSGCIRLEDARRFGRWLFDAEEPMAHPPGGLDAAVAIPHPVPLFVTYFTLGPDESGRLVERPDVYGRDHAVIAQLELPRAAWV